MTPRPRTVMLAILAALVGSVLLAAPASAAEQVVTITAEGVTPKVLTVAKGDTITFVNEDASFGYRAVATSENWDLDSGPVGLLPGRSYTHPDPIEAAGTYTYRVAEGEAYEGSVVLPSPSPKPSPTKAGTSPKPSPAPKPAGPSPSPTGGAGTAGPPSTGGFGTIGDPSPAPGGVAPPPAIALPELPGETAGPAPETAGEPDPTATTAAAVPGRLGSPPTARGYGLPAVLAAVLVAGGCGDAAAPESRAERETPRATPSATASPTAPSATPSRSAPTPTSSLTAKPSKGVGKIAPTPLPMARPDGSRTHLLTAETLPAAGADGWAVRSTAPEGSRRVGACQEASLVDIGALHAVIRVFDGPEGSGLRSRQLVARLADPKSAWRTHEVLRSWRADCEERLDYPAKDVGPMEVVDLDAGRGGHYRATYGPRKDTDAAGLGIVRAGRWLSVVEITATEGDVPTGWARRAVRRIASTFDS